jgi:hypothetical protein
MQASNLGIELDATKVSVISASLRSWAQSTQSRERDKQIKIEESVEPSRLENDREKKITANALEDKLAPVPPLLIPALDVRKRLDLSFDDVFKQADLPVSGKSTVDSPLDLTPSFQPVFFQAKVSKFTVALKLDPNMANQAGRAGQSAHLSTETNEHPTAVLRFTGDNIEVSSVVEFGGTSTGSDRWCVSKSVSTRSLASISSEKGTEPKVDDNVPSFFKVETYRFVVGSLGACDELWAKPLQLYPVGLLLLAVFADEPSPAMAYFTSFRGLHRLAPTLTAYLGEPLATGSLAPCGLALALGLGASRAYLSRRAPSEVAASAPWPWLCAEGGDSGRHLWFEALGQRKTALVLQTSSPVAAGPAELLLGSAQRPKIHLRLRKSDALFHLPTLAATANLLQGLIPRTVLRPKAGAAQHAAAPVQAPAAAAAAVSGFLLPAVSLEVQPLRVLVPYARTQAEDWSAIAALQWAFTLSATSDGSTVGRDRTAGGRDDKGPVLEGESFRVEGAFGPMDVATVTWKRRSRLRSGLASGDFSLPGSLVLQGKERSMHVVTKFPRKYIFCRTCIAQHFS